MPSLMIHGEDKDLATVSPDQMRSWVESCYAMFPLWQKNKYQVIYADPPWQYAINYANLQGIAPYPAMTLDELKSLPVGDVAAPNSLLLLWATNPLLPSALELIEAWGFRCVSARHTISFCQITMQDSDLQWAGGHFDGDGSVFISKRSNGSLPLQLAVSKSVVALSSIQRFQSMFGGNVYKHTARSGRPNRMSEVSWMVYGPEAVKVSCMLYPYVYAKKTQLAWAATYPCGESSFARKWAVGDGSWHTIAEVKANRENIRMQLKHLKEQEHQAIDGVLPLAYIAGFVDADGCLSFRKGSTTITVAQKSRAVLDAICVTLGGTVLINSRVPLMFRWSIYHGGAEALHFLLPHLFEKREQAEIILRRNGKSDKEIDALLLPLKGRQQGRRKR